MVPEVLSGASPGPSRAAPAPPATQVELAEAVRTLTDLVERVKFGGERFRIDAHGMPMAELGPWPSSVGAQRAGRIHRQDHERNPDERKPASRDSGMSSP